MPKRERVCVCDCPKLNPHWKLDEDPDSVNEDGKKSGGSGTDNSKNGDEKEKRVRSGGGLKLMRLGVVDLDELDFPPRPLPVSPAAYRMTSPLLISASQSGVRIPAQQLDAAAPRFAIGRPGCGCAERSPRANNSDEEGKPYADTPCNKATGTLKKPQYGHVIKAKVLSPCVHNLIVAHEHGHYFDAALKDACKKYKEDGNTSAWNEQVRLSECREHTLDKKCLEDLKECCGKRDSTSKAEKEKAKCCSCEDVDKAIAIVDANMKANNCG